MDNKGAVDLSKNWSVSGRTHHDEEGIITVKWIPTEENSTDIFVKNLNGPAFEKHASSYIGINEYMKQNE
jgi:hypothetical protein